MKIIYIAYMLCLCLSLGHAQTMKRFEYSEPKMGSEFRLIFYASDEEYATQVAEALYAAVDSLNFIMSDYRKDSELMQLCTDYQLHKAYPISPALFDVLCAAQRMGKLTRGAFDVANGNLYRLWKQHIRRGQVPEPEEITQARVMMGYKKFRLNKKESTLTFLEEGIRFDLGGIAKGYIAEAVKRIAMRLGVDRLLVETGGDIILGAPPLDDHGKAAKGWTISVAGSEQPLLLSHCAVATSGGTYQFVERNGLRYIHIVDPRTGWALSDYAQTTVIAGDGAMADALASCALLQPRTFDKAAKKTGMKKLIFIPVE